MILRSTFASLVTATLSLSACAPADCSNNPDLDGLATAAGCLVSGGYRAETSALRSKAAERQALANTLNQQSADLRSELARLNTQERQVANRLLAVGDSLVALESELAERTRQQRLSQTEYDIALSELESLAAQRGSIEPSDPQAQAKIAALEAEIAALRQIVG